VGRGEKTERNRLTKVSHLKTAVEAKMMLLVVVSLRYMYVTCLFYVTTSYATVLSFSTGLAIVKHLRGDCISSVST